MNPTMQTSDKLEKADIAAFKADLIYADDLPKSFEKFRHFLEAFSDERGLDQGYWLYLRPGLCWRGEVHFIHEDTVKECVEAFKQVYKCRCDECLRILEQWQ